MCFIDYAKVFDCVSHRKLWDTMGQMCFPVSTLSSSESVGTNNNNPWSERLTETQVGSTSSVECGKAA